MRQRFLPLVVTCAPLLLAACGSSNDDRAPGTAPNPPVTRSKYVAPIRNTSYGGSQNRPVRSRPPSRRSPDPNT